MSGGAGSVFIADTVARTGDWNCIRAVTDTTFTQLTSPAGKEGEIEGGNLQTIALPAHTTLHGRFDLIQLATGKVIAYKRPGGRP